MNPSVVSIREVVEASGIPFMGAASAEALNTKAPAGFRPEDILPGAKSVLVFAKPLPTAVYLTPESMDNMIHARAAYTYYQIMDNLATRLSLMLQDAGHLALPIPSYSPLRFHEGEPRGLMSLKHAAAEAGMGKLGKNTLLIHPEAGNTLRLGGLVTTMEWPRQEHRDLSAICPESCRRCIDACPSGALKGNGSIEKIVCLGACIRHTLLPASPAILTAMKWGLARSRMLSRFMELFSLNFFEIYGIGCCECLKACTHFPGNRQIEKTARDTATKRKRASK